MNAEIIAVGTEILLGDILNTNAHYLSRALAEIGIGVRYHTTVGDNPQRMAEAIRQALTRSDLVLTSGGLGPTPDDLTKEIAADVFGLPLELHQPSLDEMTAYYQNSDRDMPESNRKQAMMPKGCTVFDNPHGTAPGCAMERDGKTIIILPGPPRELIPMYETHAKPYLAGKSDGVIYSTNLHIFGLGESKAAELTSDLLDGQNPTVAPYAKSGECRLRVTAKAGTREEAKAQCAPVVDEIRRRLGSYIYGIDCGSLEQRVVTLLAEEGKHIAVAESCTGGLLSKRITDVSGSSAVFDYGIVSYANEIKIRELGVPAEIIKKHSAVSAETARSMAENARKRAGAEIGVATTGIAGPTGETETKPVGLCYIAVASDAGTAIREIRTGRLGSDRDYNRTLFASHALNLVRLLLEGETL